MRQFMVALLVCMNWPIAGWAGAWLRDEGSGFVAFGFSQFNTSTETSGQSEPSLYFEYGFRPKLTLGLTGFYSTQDRGEASAFLRFPLKSDDKPAKVSAEIGLGMRTDLIDFDPFLKTGLSWGRGLSFGEKSGWVNLDSAVLWSLGDIDNQLKLDATVGMGLNDRFQVMGQAFYERDSAGQSLTLVPSVIMGLGAAKKTKLVVGLEHRGGRRASDGIRFGLWRDFKLERKRP